MLANEYLRLPGNVEVFFPLLLVMFWLAAAITTRGAGLVRSVALPPWSRRLEAGTGVRLLVIAAFVLFGLHLPALVDAMGPAPSAAAYLDAPTAFWVVKVYDLGIVVPAATVVGPAGRVHGTGRCAVGLRLVPLPAVARRADDGGGFRTAGGPAHAGPSAAAGGGAPHLAS